MHFTTSSGSANYGGRVTDAHDRTLINCLLRTFVSSSLLKSSSASNELSHFPIPPPGTREELLAAIQLLARHAQPGTVRASTPMRPLLAASGKAPRCYSPCTQPSLAELQWGCDRSRQLSVPSKHLHLRLLHPLQRPAAALPLKTLARSSLSKTCVATLERLRSLYDMEMIERCAPNIVCRLQ